MRKEKKETRMLSNVLGNRPSMSFSTDVMGESNEDNTVYIAFIYFFFF